MKSVRGSGRQSKVAVPSWLLLSVLVLLPAVSASQGQYASFQPANVEGQWQTGVALRICPVEAPTGPATATSPSGGTQSLSGDSEGCWGLTPNVAGAWTVSWPVAGPATRTVTFTAWGAAPLEVGFWVEFAFWFLLIGACLWYRFWLTLAFAIGGSFHLITPDWPFDVHWLIPYLLIATLAEWGAQRRKLRKKR